MHTGKNTKFVTRYSIVIKIGTFELVCLFTLWHINIENKEGRCEIKKHKLYALL